MYAGVLRGWGGASDHWSVCSLTWGLISRPQLCFWKNPREHINRCLSSFHLCLSRWQTVLTKRKVSRSGPNLHFLSVLKTIKLSPHLSPQTFLSSPLANSSQSHTLAWSRLRPSEVVWALLQGILSFWVFTWSDSSLQSGLLKYHLLKDTFCDHGRFVLQHWGPKPGFYTHHTNALSLSNTPTFSKMFSCFPKCTSSSPWICSMTEKNIFYKCAYFYFFPVRMNALSLLVGSAATCRACHSAWGPKFNPQNSH